MNIRRIGTTVAPLVIASIVLGPLFSVTTSATLRSHHPSSVPKGWKTYTYGKARISSTGDWAVERDSDCPIRSASGTLSLGNPKRLSQCPDGFPNANLGMLSPLSGGDHYNSLCPPIRVNGLDMNVGRCATSDAAGIVIYWVPALGVQAVGTGTNSENVTGPGTGTVVGRVLHTLRR